MRWVEKWAAILRLTHMDIRVQFHRDGKNDATSDSRFGVVGLVRYKEDQHLGEGERTVVHELLHIKFGLFDDLNGEMAEAAAPSAPVYKMWRAAMHWPREYLIEQLAEILVELQGGECVELDHDTLAKDPPGVVAQP